MCKINVNFNRKITDNNYGSFGAGVSFEFEVDTAKNINADQLQDRIRKAFRLAQKAVERRAGPLPDRHCQRCRLLRRQRRGPARVKAVARRVPGVSVASDATVVISGKSFLVKDQLKALGGRWDPKAKTWRVPAAKAEQAKRLVAAA